MSNRAGDSIRRPAGTFGVAVALSLSWTTCAAAIEISGLMSKQVFQRQDPKSGTIRFTFSDSSEPLTTTLTGSDLSQTQSTEDASGTIAFTHVPVGGPYRLAVGGAKFEELYVGELWIVSGQSNAFGYSYDADETTHKGPMPGVHLFMKHGNSVKTYPMTGDRDEQMAGWAKWVAEFEWMQAEDPLFWRNKMNNGPWVTAAQEFYYATGVPVGLMGHAQGGRPIKYFLSMDETEMRFLKPIVDSAGRGAARFLWYQGEGDAYVRYSPYYRQRFEAMVRALRRYTENPDLTIGVVQLCKFQNVYAPDRVGLFRNAYAEMRELQRNMVLETDHAVLFSTITANVKNAGVHLTARGYVDLGEQIAHVFARHEKTGKLAPAGPQPKSVTFANESRQKIVVQFAGDTDGLQGGDTPEQWAVYDRAHPPGIDGWFSVNGVDESGEKRSRPVPNGYPDIPKDRQINNVIQPSVPIAAVRVNSEARSIHLELEEPVGPEATLSYAYISHLLGNLRNADGYPAPGFTYIPIPSDNLDSRARDDSARLKPPPARFGRLSPPR